MFKRILFVSGAVLVLGACDDGEKTPISTAEHEYRSMDYFGLDKENIPKTELFPIEPYAASAGTDVSAEEALLSIEAYYETPFYMGGTATLSDTYWGYGEGREGASFAMEVTSHSGEVRTTFYLERGTHRDLYNTLLTNDVELFLTGVIPDLRDEDEYIATGYVTDIEVIKARPEESYLPSEDLQAFMDEMGLSTTEREVRFDPYEFPGRYFAYEGLGQMLPQTGYWPSGVDPEEYFKINVSHRSKIGMNSWTLFFEREKFQDLFEAAKTGLVELKTVNFYDQDLITRFTNTMAFVREAEYAVVEPAFSTVTQEGQAYMKQQGVELTGRDVLFSPYSYLDTPFFLEGTAELILGDENADTFKIQLPIDPYYQKDPFESRNNYLEYGYHTDYETFELNKADHSELYALLQEQDVNVRVIAEIDQEMLEDDTALVGRILEAEW